MMIKTDQWIGLSKPFTSFTLKAIQQQHHASQFISLVGRYLANPLSDYSHISMRYVFGYKMLVGKQLPSGYYIGLDLKTLEVSLLNTTMEKVGSFSLEGKTFESAYSTLQSVLTKNQIDIVALQTKQPFELANDFLIDGTYSLQNMKEENIEVINYRHNANVVLSEVAKANAEASPIAIWPHHFDTGFLLPLLKNGKGDTLKSIGLGWAIPDEMVPEPYYYISFWSENKIGSMKELSQLKHGSWMLPNWNGAVLKSSEILEEKNAKEQYELVMCFFENGINELKNKF